MLPSVLPRLGTDSAVRVFPGVWKLLSFKAPFLGWSSVPTSFVSFFVFYIFPTSFRRQWATFLGVQLAHLLRWMTVQDPKKS